MNMSGCLKLWGSVLSRLFVSLKVPKENFGHNICVLTTFFRLWVHMFRTKEEKLAKETKTMCSFGYPTKGGNLDEIVNWIVCKHGYDWVHLIFWKRVFLQESKRCFPAFSFLSLYHFFIKWYHYQSIFRTILAPQVL